MAGSVGVDIKAVAPTTTVCMICLEYAKEPFIAPCRHVACLACWKQWRKTREDAHRSVAGDVRARCTCVHDEAGWPRPSYDHDHRRAHRRALTHANRARTRHAPATDLPLTCH